MTFPFVPSTNNDDLANQVARLTQQYQRLDGLISGWTKSGGTDPYFDFLRARDGFFDSMPFDSILLVSTTDQEIVSGVAGIVNWDSARIYSANMAWSSVPGLSSAIHFGQSIRGRPMLAFGIVQFSSNAVGRRAVALSQYNDSSVVQSGNSPISVGNAGANEITAVSFAFPMNTLIAKESSNAFTKMEVFQNSGSTITMLSARLGILRLV